MKKVLLVVDNPHREMRGMVAIWLRLKKKGIFSHIVSKTSFTDWYDILQPDVVVLPRATSEIKPFIEAKFKETEIVVIPSEHGSGFEQKVLNNAFGPNYWDKGKNDSAIDKASLILVGGDNQKKWLDEKLPSQQNQIKVVGTLSSDHWFKPKHTRSNEMKVGICTTFKSMFLSSADNSIHQLLYVHLSPNYSENRWRLYFQNYELHYLARIFEVVDCLLKKNYKVDIRPHPHEYWAGWKYWQKNLDKHVLLNREIDLSKWIDSNKICITTFSTTALDCIARGVASISLERLITQEIAQVPEIRTPLTGEYSWRPSSIKEMLILVEKAKNGTLACSPNLEVANEFMALNFNWPRPESCATLCTDAIIKLLKHSEKKRKNKCIQRYLKLPKAIFKIFAKDIRDYFGPRKNNLLFTLSLKLWFDAFKYNKNIKV